MSYINIPIFLKSGLHSSDLIFLAAIKNKETEFLKQYLTEENYNRLKEKGLVEHVQAKNKTEHLYSSLRVTSKTNKLLDDISTPLVKEEHLKMCDYLIMMYLNHEDKERVIGNRKLIAIYISVLQAHLGIDIHRLYYLCEFFLSEHVFSKKLENVFMDRNKIRYGDFKQHIHDAPIFQFYEQRKQDVEWYWSQKIKTE